VSRIARENDVSREAAGNVVAGNVSLGKLLLRRDIRRNLSKNRHRSCLQDAKDSREKIVIHILGDKALHGKIMEFEPYEILFLETPKAYSHVESKSVTLPKLTMKYAYPPAFDSHVTNRRETDEKLRDAGLAIPTKVENRRNTSNAFLQVSKIEETPLVLRTYDGDRFAGNLSWWGQFELGLHIGGGVIITFFRHAIYDLLSPSEQPCYPEEEEPKTVDIEEVPQKKEAPKTPVETPVETQVETPVVAKPPLGQNSSPEKFYRDQPWLSKISDDVLADTMALMQALIPHRDEALAAARKGQGALNYILKALHSGGRIDKTRVSSLATACATAEYAILHEDMIRQELEASFLRIPRKDIISEKYLRLLRKGMDRNRFRGTRTPERSVNEAYFQSIFRFAMAFYGDAFISGMVKDMRGETNGQMADLMAKRKEAMELAEKIQAQIDQLLG
jgi:sRNA-binding regulator protein Hfq